VLTSSLCSMKFCRRAYGIWFVLALSVIQLGCASTAAPQPPSLELPKPVGDLHASRKGSQVTLAWTVPSRTTDRQNLRHLGRSEICRGLEIVIVQCDVPVGEVSPPAAAPIEQRKNGPAPNLAASYTDTLSAELQQQNPTADATYAIAVFNTRNRSAGFSNQVHVPLAPTLPPPSDFHGEVTADGVVLTWTGVEDAHPSPSISHIYRVYRRDASGVNWYVISDLPLEAPGTVRFVDHSFEWEKTYDYRLAIVSVVKADSNPTSEVEGDDSAPVQVVARDVFPPAVPTGLQAVFSGPGQKPFVDLIWAPDTDADLAGYNVYRSENGSQPAKLNEELVKAPAYRDSGVSAGREYEYSISAVDVRGNESTRSQPASEKVP